MKVCSTKEVFG